MNGVLSFTQRTGRAGIEALNEFGAAWIYLSQILIRVFSPPFRFRLIVHQVHAIGVESVPVIVLVGIFTGAVLAVQGEYTLAQFGATAYTSSAIALSLIRELGPVLTALMVIGRAGSAMTAELGIMKISEQVDALRSMAVDPMRYLIVPRFVAGIIAMPLLTAVFDIVGIAGGYIVGIQTLDLSSGTFMTQMIKSVKDVDIISGFVKSVAFGFCFGWICSYKGWTCGFGAVGVNRATTQSVVTASVVVLVLDYFLTSILTQVFL